MSAKMSLKVLEVSPAAFKNKLMGFARLMRLANTFTVVSNILAAHIIATAGNVQWHVLLVTIAASMCFYHAGMVINDCLDIEEDAIHDPDRPLPKGIVSLSQAWVLAGGLLALGLGLSYFAGVLCFLVAVVLVVAILTYNLSNRTGLYGCFTMGTCRFLNWCLGLSVAGELFGLSGYAFVVAFYVIALTILSRDEVHAQRPLLLRFSASVMMLGLVVLFVTLWHQDLLSPLALALSTAALVVVLGRFYRLSKSYSPATIRTTVGFMIMGLIPLDALLTLMAGYPVAAAFILLLIVPARALARRFYVT